MQIKVKKTKHFSGEYYSPEVEEERAAHEYAAHKRYKVPPYDAGQMDKGLSYLLALQGINLITAEDEDLVVAENLLRGRISVLGGGELH